MSVLTTAQAIIATQQAGKEGTCTHMVGEQLKEMLRKEPELEELLAHDLTVTGMGIADCEKKIRTYAMAHGGGCPPDVAEKIIREFYGLPEKKAAQEKRPDGIVSLLDLL